MATKMSILPLAIICNNAIFRHHILRINNNDFELTPFDRECEATRFVSNVVIIANPQIIHHISTMPKIRDRYENLSEVVEYLNQHNLYALKNEGLTLISASPLGYSIL